MDGEPQSEFIYVKHPVRPRNVFGRSQVAMGLILGSVVGGIYGCVTGARAFRGRSRKLAMILSHISKHGAAAGRAGGVLMLMYAGFGTAMTKCRGIEDEANTVLSSAASGYLYSCTRGFQPMLFSGALGLAIGMSVAVANSGVDLIIYWKTLIENFVNSNSLNSPTEQTENDW